MPLSAAKQDSVRTVMVTGDGGLRFRASMRIAAADAFSISTTRADDNGLVAGDEVDVVTDSGTRLRAQVLSTTEMGQIQICDLRVVRWFAGPSLVDNDERRAHPRVGMPPRTPVSLTIDESLGKPYAVGYLLDVSLGGCRMELDRSQANGRALHHPLWMKFNLEGIGDIEIEAEVLNTYIGRDNMIALGCRWLDADIHRPSLDAIDRYVKRNRLSAANLVG
ncbi:MAG: PilZ domain-containing protein [Actinomycetota bacterium]